MTLQKSKSIFDEITHLPIWRPEEEYQPWGIYYPDGTVIFEPFPKQVLFLESTAPYVLYGGSRGSGKSGASLWKAIFTCLRIPGCNVAIVRKTYGQLEKSIIRPFGNIPHKIYSENPKAFNRSTNIVKFDNGSCLYFLGCQNADSARNSFKGSEFVCIIVDEITEFTYEEFEEMKGGNRCPIKEDIYGDSVICQLVGLTNPGGPGHSFIKALFVDKNQISGKDPEIYDPTDYDFIKALPSDNPVYSNDYAYMKTLETMSPALVQAYRWGNWDIFAGQYYDNFSINASVIDEDIILREMNIQSWQPRWISIDWAFTHDTSVQWHTSLNINGEEKIITYREFNVQKMGESALAEEINRMTGMEKISHVYLSPDCFGDNPNARHKMIGNILVQNHIIQSNGRRVENPLPRPIPASNERVDGWRFLYEMLSGRPQSKLLISSACSDLIESIPLLIRNAPTKPEDVKKIDQKADDVADSWRYGIYSYCKPRKKPDELIYQEKLASITNPTQKNIFRLMNEHKKKQIRKGFVLK